MTTASDPLPQLGDVVEVASAGTVVRLDGMAGRLDELVVTGDVADSLGAVLGAAAGETGAGFLVVGPFGSGKSHFLAALGELVQDPAKAAEALGPGWSDDLRHLAGRAPRLLPVPVPLVEYRARARLEDVVAARAWKSLGRTAEVRSDDRAAAWDALFDAVREGTYDGLLLLVDELSEFLRAKQGPDLTEDLRFLQFIGEWSRARPVVVVAALQESIEEVANVSQRELARIRDRYRPSLRLSMRHVEDLVRGRLVRIRPDGDHWVRVAHAAVCSAFPEQSVGYEELSRCYERRVLPSLAELQDDVPLVVLADHGFRENPNWGLGPEGRYVHGGTSLEECVVPVVVVAAVRHSG